MTAMQETSCVHSKAVKPLSQKHFVLNTSIPALISKNCLNCKIIIGILCGQSFSCSSNVVRF